MSLVSPSQTRNQAGQAEALQFRWDCYIPPMAAVLDAWFPERLRQEVVEPLRLGS